MSRSRLEDSNVQCTSSFAVHTLCGAQVFHVGGFSHEILCKRSVRVCLSWVQFYLDGPLKISSFAARFFVSLVPRC